LNQGLSSVSLTRTVQLDATNKSLESEIIVRRQANKKSRRVGAADLLPSDHAATGERRIAKVSCKSSSAASKTNLPVISVASASMTSLRTRSRSSGRHQERADGDGTGDGGAGGDSIDENGLSAASRPVGYEPDISQVQFPSTTAGARRTGARWSSRRCGGKQKSSGVLIAARRKAHDFVRQDFESVERARRAAAHQAQLYGALRQAYEDLRQTQQAVLQQERLRALGQMASGIAHDINNAHFAGGTLH